MAFSLVQPLRTIPIACLDLETSGFSVASGGKPIEIGVIRYENGRKVAEYQQLIDPRRRISPMVTALTGITQAMCLGQPTFAQQFPAMLPILTGAMILGHNIRFDLSFLIHEFARCGHDMEKTLDSPQVLDTVRIARHRFGRGGNALVNLAHRLGYEPPIAHRALPDAETTAIIFEKLIDPVGGWDMCLCDCLMQQGGPMRLLPKTPMTKFE